MLPVSYFCLSFIIRVNKSRLIQLTGLLLILKRKSAVRVLAATGNLFQNANGRCTLLFVVYALQGHINININQRKVFYD